MCTTGEMKTEDHKKADTNSLELPQVMKFFTFYYFFRMGLLDVCYLTLFDMPTFQILLPLTIEGIFIVIVCISAKLTNVFGSKFVVFRLVLQGSSIFLWLLMAYFGTFKTEKWDYRGFRKKEYAQALPYYMSIFMEWLTVFLIMAMLVVEVIWSLRKIYASAKTKVIAQIEKIRRKKARKKRKEAREARKRGEIDDQYFKVGTDKTIKDDIRSSKISI
jgi:signal transduction histidine kinase